MNTITPSAFQFMADLWENNSKQWFDENRKQYETDLKKPLKALSEDLAEKVPAILPDFEGKVKISRINNDIRFSPNKPPYKEHMWISYGMQSGNAADIFAAVDRHGWMVGCGITAPRKEEIDYWRVNLMTFQKEWRNYAKIIRIGKSVRIYAENPYKKPLMPDIPEDLYDLIQARGVWLVEEPKPVFEQDPVTDIFKDICKFLPLYLFMQASTENLQTEFSKLNTTIQSTDPDIQKIWASVSIH